MVPTAETRSLLYTLPLRLPALCGKAGSCGAAFGSSSPLLGGTDVDRFSAVSLCCCCCRRGRETLLFEADRALRSEPLPPPPSSGMLRPPRESDRKKRPTIDSEAAEAGAIVEPRSASVVVSCLLTSRFL